MLGGVRKARMEILRHVLERVTGPRALALEVGIGNGENLAFLPAGWTVYGVDIARTQLEDCIRRHPADGRTPRLGRGREPAFCRRDV